MPTSTHSSSHSHAPAHSNTHSHPRPAHPAQPAAAVVVPKTFLELALLEPLQRALAEKNYSEPSPIQAQTIPHLLAGHDVIGCAQTGTGKTAAFALPILQRLANNPKPPTPRRPRALILAPTRELAVQIDQSFADYGKHLKITHTAIFGGVSMSHQVRALTRGVDIVIATPGRLADLERQRHISFDQVEVFVLDEADRMLDQGFIHEIKRVISKLPPKKQSLLFSATMPREIEELANSIVRNPVRISVAPESTTAERVEQQVAFVEAGDKVKMLVHLLNQHQNGLVLVFVRMKHMANRLVEQLDKSGLKAEAIHGNKSQGARQRALENFRTGHKRIMVATDIAARGIDVKGITLVINFNLPEEPEAYVHRIGRTARAGKDGMAIALCDRTERSLLRSIERIIRQPIPVLKDHPFVPTAASYAAAHDEKFEQRPRSAHGQNRGSRPQGRSSSSSSEGGRPPQSRNSRFSRFGRSSSPQRSAAPRH